MDFTFVVIYNNQTYRPCAIDFDNKKVLIEVNGKKEWLSSDVVQIVLESNIKDIDGNCLYDGCYVQVLDTYYSSGEQIEHYIGQIVFCDASGWFCKVTKILKDTKPWLSKQMHVPIHKTAKIKLYATEFADNMDSFKTDYQ